MKKVLAILLIAIVALSGAFANGGKETAASGLKTVNVAYMTNYASLCSVVAGIETGAFEEQGIKVNLIEFADGPTIINALESGTVDIGYIGQGAHKLCINGQADIFAFSHNGNADVVIGLKSHGITDIASLRGKTVGYSSGTSSENVLDLALKRAGMTKNDIKAMEMDASALTSAATSGNLDAVATWSPSSFTIMDQLGDDAIVLAQNVDFTDETVNIASWIVAPGWADKNHDLLVAFTKALYKGMDYRAENVEQTAEWVAKQLGSSYDTVYLQRGDAEWITSSELLSRIEDGTIKNMYELQKQAFAGSVDLATPVEDYVLFDIMLEAGK